MCWCIKKKTKTQKSIAFLYSNYEEAEREINKTIPFTIPPKIIKYLGMNLTKEVKDLFSENYKALMREIKMTQINGKIFHAHRLEEHC